MTKQEGKRVHRVRQGECASSIAADEGFLWETIWNDADNSGLREQRQDPNAFLPGDEVTVPAIATKQEDVATEQKHQFRKLGTPLKLRIRLLNEGQPRAGIDCTLDLEGKLIEGCTDGDGLLEINVSPSAKKGKLILRDGEEPIEIPIAIGEIDPANTLSGAQGRLRNLGYNVGLIDNSPGPRTSSAIRTFQKDNNLEVSGELDDATIDELKNRFGG